MNIGNTIKTLRKKKGLKQGVLAENVGITQTYLSHIECNKCEPSIGLLKNIAFELGIPFALMMFITMDQDDVKPTKQAEFDKTFPAIKNMITTFFV